MSNTRCYQKVLGTICFGEIHWIKIFVSWSFDLIEGHWECEKHAAMLDCLCKSLLREEGATHFAKSRNVKSARLSSTSVSKCQNHKQQATPWRRGEETIKHCKNHVLIKISTIKLKLLVFSFPEIIAKLEMIQRTI